MNEIQRQRPDGSWGPAEPMPWQGGPLSIDWEVSKPHYPAHRWVASAFHHADHITTVRARTRWGLQVKMRRAARRWRRRQRH